MAYITNGHDINLKTFYPKSYLFGYGLLLLFSIVMLVIPVTYFLGFFIKMSSIQNPGLNR